MRSTWRGRHSPAGIVMIAAMLGAVCAMVWAALVPATYSATAKAFVSTTDRVRLLDVPSADGFEQQALQSYASVAVAPIVLRPVVEQLDLGTTSASLASRISVTNPVGTAVLAVAVSDSSPARAAATADAVVQRLAVASARLSPSGDAAALRVTPIERAAVPRSPAGLPLLLAVLLGLAAGALVGAVVLAVRRARGAVPTSV